MSSTGDRNRALQWAPWLVLLLAALLVRWPVWTGPLDREFDGFQGGFFATTTVNYERLGLGAADGYPVANVELDAERSSTWYVYPNHPPTVPLLAWGSARLFGPDGWRDAWREQRAPEGLEPALRLPFGLAQLATALGLATLLILAGRRAAAPLALAAFAFAPIEVGYAGLVNYEHPAMAAAVWTGVAVLAWCRAPGPARLAACALGGAAGTAVTFAPAFFLPGYALLALRLRGWAAWKPTVALGLGALTPILLHRHFGGGVLAAFDLSPDPLFDRVRRLLAPLLDGSLPFGRWLAIQWESALVYLGPELCALGAAGLLLAAHRTLRGSSADRAIGGIVLALFSGGALAHVAFYKHTGDPQPSFLLNLAPGLAAAAGLALAAVAVSAGCASKDVTTPDEQIPNKFAGAPDWVHDFARWSAARLDAGAESELLEWMTQAPHARRNHPTPEHFLPLFVTMGAAGEHWRAEQLHRSISREVLALDAWRFAPSAQGCSSSSGT